MTVAKGDTGFVRFKSRQVITWTLANLARLHLFPSAVDIERRLDGQTAIIVGAGPSLAKNIQRIGDAQSAGALVVASNAAGRPLRAAGIDPDVMVLRESLDLSDEVEASRAPLICADVGAHPRSWDAAGDRLAWFLPLYPRHLQIAQRLSVRPVGAGTAALTTAVALAGGWGCSRIVLAGVDLAIAADGAAYHPDAPRGDCRATVEGKTLRFEGNVEDDARAVRSGQQPQPKRAVYERVIAHDFRGTVITTDVLADQMRWLSVQAERHHNRVELLNATEGGAGIFGWRASTMAAVVDVIARELEGAGPEGRHYPTPRRVVEPSMTEQLLEELAREAAALGSVARRMLAPRGPELAGLLDVPDLYYQSPLIECLAAWRTIDATGTPAERCEHIYRAFLDASAEAEALIARCTTETPDEAQSCS